MLDPNFILLYVASPAASAEFYAQLLGGAPIEQSPTFAMFALPSGTRLGLWLRDTVEPAATGTPGAGELAFALGSRDAVDALHAQWSGRGMPIVQAPQAMDFGYTFVSQDLDGHRLRVFVPG